jgi:DNA mismatch endonuclease, patch repair protein
MDGTTVRETKRVLRKRKAGHRAWAARNQPVAGAHTGDIMSPQTRSEVMSRIRGRNTSPERILCSELRRHGVYFSTHVSELPGRPDIVFRRAKLVVFIDGDFWHGWRFPLWRHKLSDKWQEKIGATRDRDRRNFGMLRRVGWKVVRIWEHEIEIDPARCVARILSLRVERLGIIQEE